jgi:hypothetical protein
MRTLYALIIACLSVQPSNGQAQTPADSINISRHSTLSEYLAAAPMGDDDRHPAAVTVPAIKPFEGYWMDEPIASTTGIAVDVEEHDAGAAPAIEPIYGAEFEGTSRDDALIPWSALPITPMLEDYTTDWPIDDGLTAAVTSPASKPEEEQPIDFSAAREEDDNTASVTVAPTPILDDSIDGDQFHLGDERHVIETENNDPHAMQAKDWW